MTQTRNTYVHVVHYWEQYESDRLVGVFSTAAKAKKHVAKVFVPFGTPRAEKLDYGYKIERVLLDEG